MTQQRWRKGWRYLLWISIWLAPTPDGKGQVPIDSKQVLGNNNCLVIDENGYQMSNAEAADIAKLAAKNNLQVTFYVHTISKGVLQIASMYISSNAQKHTPGKKPGYKGVKPKYLDSLFQSVGATAFRQRQRKNRNLTRQIWEARNEQVLAYYLVPKTQFKKN